MFENAVFGKGGRTNKINNFKFYTLSSCLLITVTILEINDRALSNNNGATD